jgi:PKD repeat protein
VDNTNLSITLALDTAAKGALSTSAIASDTIANVQATLRAVVFTPAADRVAVGSTETITLSINANDGSTTTTDVITTVISTSINDAPVVSEDFVTQVQSNINEDAEINEDATFSFTFEEFSLCDSDPGDSATYSVTSTLPSWISFNAGTRTFSGTPLNEDVGALSITIRGTDTHSAFIEDGFTLNILNTNDAPTATDNTITLNEDASHTFSSSDFGFNDIDSGDTLASIKITTLESVGTLQLSGVDVVLNEIIVQVNIVNLIFTPLANANGAGYDSFTFSVNDGTTNSVASNTLTLDVAAVNDAPTITTGNGSNILENNTNIGTVVTTDLENDTITYTLSGGVDQALFSIHASSGVLTFNTAPDFENPTDDGNNNSYLVEITATDDGAGTLSDTLALTVNIQNENDAPIITSNSAGTTASVTMVENTTAITTITSSDDEGDIISYSLSGGVDQALFTLAGAVLTFTAAPDFEAPIDNGADNTYIVEVTATDDGAGTLTDVQTITITVTDTNELPTAADNTITILEDASHTFSANEFGFSDVDGDTLASVTIKNSPANGTLSVAKNDVITLANISTIIFTPDANENGTLYASFDFTVNDGKVDSASPNSITFDVTAQNDAPSNINISASTIDENNNINDTVATITTVDIDAGDTFSYTLVNGAGDSDNGSFSIDADALKITVVSDFETKSNYSVRLQATDSVGATYEEVMMISINDINEAPTISGTPTTSTDEDLAYSFTPTVNDVEGDTLSFSIANTPSWASFNATTGELSGTPTNADVGVYSAIGITITDTRGLSNTLIFSITVNNTNDLATLSGTVINQVVNDTSTLTPFSAIVLNDDDLDNLSLTITLGDNEKGTLSLSAIASDTVANVQAALRAIIFTPTQNRVAVGDNETTTFTITLNDGTGDTIDSTTTVISTSINDAPTALDNTLTVTEDIAYFFDSSEFGFSDIDPSSSLVSIQVTTLPTTGSLKLSGDTLNANDIILFADIPKLRFTPLNNENGVAYDSFTFSVNDGIADSAASFTITLDVTAINDTPTILGKNLKSFETTAIDIAADGATDTIAIDIDRDGDIDILASSSEDDTVAWYENDGSENFTKNIITTTADGVTDIFAIDINNDGDIDILSASVNDNTIARYINDGSQNFTKIPINSSATQASSVHAIDIDSDGDIDALSASRGDNTIRWYENDGARNFSVHVISSNETAATSVFAVDLDQDGDSDILVTSYFDNSVSWYENDGSEQFTKNLISASVNGAIDVMSIDIDSDGDLDVLCAAQNDNAITWYENDGLESFTAHTITTTANGIEQLYSLDIDNDNDIDVLSASSTDNTIAWYENSGSQNFTKHIISDTGISAKAVFASDINSDGHINILSASQGDDTIAIHNPTHYLTTTVAENQTSVLTVTANDIENDAITFSIDGTDSALFSIDSVSGVITFNSAPDFEISSDENSDNLYEINVTVTANGDTDKSPLEISVVNANETPSVATLIPDQSTSQDTLFSFSFALNTFDDIDNGDTLTYSTTQDNDTPLPSWLSFTPATRTFSGTPLNTDVGTLSIKVIASDLLGTSISDTFDLVINNVNDAPTLNNPIENQTSDEDAAFSFTLPNDTFNDIDIADTLIFNAILENDAPLPSWLVFDKKSQHFSGIPHNADVGTIQIKVIASDSANASIFDTFSLTTNNTNDAPTITGTPLTALVEDSLYSFSPLGVDVDSGDTLSYTITNQPSWTSFDTNTGILSGTPTNDNIGIFSDIVISVSDTVEIATLASFDITVINSNDAPNDILISTTHLNENNLANAIVATLHSVDDDSVDTATFTLVSGEGDSDNTHFKVIANTLHITPISDFETQASYSIRVRVTDSEAASFEKTFTLFIDDINDAPTARIDVIQDEIIAGVSEVTFNAIVADVDNNISSILWSLSDEHNTSFSGERIHHTFSKEGNYSVRLHVTDEENLTTTVIGSVEVLKAAPHITISLAQQEAIAGETAIRFTSTSNDPDGNSSALSYLWDFGDEKSSILANPTHTFAHSGSYNVTCTTTDEDGLTTISNIATLQIKQAVPQPKIFVSQNEGVVNQTAFNFHVDIRDSDSEEFTILWDFGDQSSSDEQNSSHIYTNIGLYTVSVTVRDSDGNQATDTIRIDRVNIGPSVSILTSALSGIAPFSIDLNASIIDSDSSDHTILWYFNKTQTASDKDLIYTLRFPGSYDFNVTVTDEHNLSDTATVHIDVLEPEVTDSNTLKIKKGDNYLSLPFKSTLEKEEINQLFGSHKEIDYIAKYSFGSWFYWFNENVRQVDPTKNRFNELKSSEGLYIVATDDINITLSPIETDENNLTLPVFQYDWSLIGIDESILPNALIAKIEKEQEIKVKTLRIYRDGIDHIYVANRALDALIEDNVARIERIKNTDAVWVWLEEED